MSAPRRVFIVLDRTGSIVGAEKSRPMAADTISVLDAQCGGGPYVIDGPYEKPAKRRRRRKA